MYPRISGIAWEKGGYMEKTGLSKKALKWVRESIDLTCSNGKSSDSSPESDKISFGLYRQLWYIYQGPMAIVTITTALWLKTTKI